MAVGEGKKSPQQDKVTEDQRLIPRAKPRRTWCGLGSAEKKMPEEPQAKRCDVMCLSFQQGCLVVSRFWMSELPEKEEIGIWKKQRDKAGEKTVSLFSAMGRAKTVSCMWRSDHSVNHLRKRCGPGLFTSWICTLRMYTVTFCFSSLFLFFFSVSLFSVSLFSFPAQVTQITPSPGGDTRIFIDMRYFYLTHVRQHSRLTLPSPHVLLPP